MSVPVACSIFVGVCVAALLVAEKRGARALKWTAKPLASIGFVALAAANGATESAYGRAVLAALVLSFLGDVLLLPEGTGRAFIAGVLAFLGAHVAFAIAFVVRGVAAASIEGGAFVLVPAGVIGAIGFARKAHGPLRAAVVVYTAVLSTMALLALGTYGAHGGAAIAVGAVAFYLSDLSVGLDRFVSPSFAHRAWGLPLYYAAQVLFAWSAG